MEDEETILVECDYNTNLFDGDVLQAWTAGYENLLRAIVQDVNQAVDRLTLTTATPKGHWVVADSDKPERQMTGITNLHDLVAAQAALTPDAIAVEGDGSQLSYRELDHQAGRLAAHFKVRGVGSGDLVGVCLARSPRLPIALLGLLKAGVAYLPMDSVLSVDRLSEILSESEPKLLIVDDSTADMFTGNTTVEQIGIEALLDGAADETSDPLPMVSAEHPAYVTFTSGATGRPKGVEISHSAVINLLQALSDEPGFDATDVMLATSPMTSFVSALEFWLPLSMGARIVIAPCETAMDPTALDALIAKHGITVMQATPSILQRLIQAEWPGMPTIARLERR